MSHAAEPTTQTDEASTRFGPRLVHLVLLGFGCVGIAYFLPVPELGAGVFFSGIGLLTVAALIGLIDWRRARDEKSLLHTILDIVEFDAAPCFTTDTGGAVVHQNRVALDRFGDRTSAMLADALNGVLAAPGTVTARLQSRATSTGSAREEVALRRGQLRVAVHRMGEERFLWRFEDVTERKSGSPGGEGIGLPMLTVSKGDTVLHMNDALRRLVGKRDKALEQIVLDLPLRPNEVHRIATTEGPQRATIVEVTGPAGRRELYFLPVLSTMQPVQWDMVDTLPVPLMKATRDGRVVMANRMAKELLRVEADEAPPVAALIEGLGRPIDAWIAEAADGRAPPRPEFLRAARAPQDVYVQVTLSPLKEDDETYVVAVLNDATELKTLEAQFVQSQKMQAIGQLAGGVAHDFNNLLTAISGHCDLLLLRRDPGDPDYADLEQINQNANRAAALVGQLLAFSRKQNLRPELLDLKDTMGDLAHLLNRLVGETIHLTLAHDPDERMIRADRRQFEQVIVNLVVNARDAMPAGGEIAIETEMATLSDELVRDRAMVPPGSYVLVRVRDEGGGIPPEVLPKIFEPFFTTKRSGEGTGLGLSTVYGIVKQSGGFIFADSDPGQGTTFSLYFPAHDAPAEAREEVRDEPAKPRAAQGQGVVLLVEDEAPVRAFASRALRLRGYTVIEAASAEEALDKLKDPELAVDVFVTDVVMPGMDGPKWVAQALKKRPGTRVIFVSGYAEESVADGQARIPGSVFLPKPFSLTQLTDTVQAQLQ